jgi:mannose-6-phosphate isomerase-like protein (cupin superfamily)
MQVIEGAGRYTPAPDGEPNHWAEHLASSDLSVGTYSLPAGGLDDQHPHSEDEIYVVQAGTATLVTDSGSAEVGPGSVIFVPAGERHQFTDVGGDLALLVIFAPPYNSRGQADLSTGSARPGYTETAGSG